MSAVKPLFGGGLSCDIPSDWKDVSEIRQVPDHQECYMGPEEELLVVEILERQTVSDAEAASFFFQDLAESNGAVMGQDASFRAYPLENQAGIEGAVPLGGRGFQKVAMGRDHDVFGNKIPNQQVKWVLIELCVFRLPSVESDLLVTLSKPIPNPNEPPVLGDTPSWTTAFQRIAASVRVQNWGLFG